MGIVLKLLASVFVGVISYYFKWLTFGGSVITSLMAFVILFKLGWFWAFPPLLFLTMGSILSILSGKRERRDYKQVLANGLTAIICAFLEFEGGYITAISVAFSDTTATEMGIKFAKRTYLITNFKEVPKGTSGGISFIGTISGLTVIALLSLCAWVKGINPFKVFIAATVGFFSDSIIGATLENKGYFGNNTTNLLSNIIGVLVYILSQL